MFFYRTCWCRQLYKLGHSFIETNNYTNLVSSNETLCSVHGNGSHCVLSQMLSNLQNETGFASCHVQGVENLRESILKLQMKTFGWEPLTYCIKVLHKECSVQNASRYNKRPWTGSISLKMNSFKWMHAWYINDLTGTLYLGFSVQPNLFLP